MNEKLIPFDFAAFVKDPSRLRHRDGAEPERASVALDNCVCVVWRRSSGFCVYPPHDFCLLRLAAKTQIVKVRLLRSPTDGRVSTISELDVNLNSPNYIWCSDIIEIEVTA